MQEFNPTHKLLDVDRAILVQELVGDQEFYDEQELEEWSDDPVGIGNYAIDDDDKDLVLIRSSSIEPEFGEIVVWEKAPHLKLVRICVKCHSDRIVKNGRNGYTQRYLCRDCGATFTGTSMGRNCIGDKPMTNAEHQAKFRAKNKEQK